MRVLHASLNTATKVFGSVFTVGLGEDDASPTPNSVPNSLSHHLFKLPLRIYCFSLVSVLLSILLLSPQPLLQPSHGVTPWACWEPPSPEREESPWLCLKPLNAPLHLVPSPWLLRLHSFLPLLGILPRWAPSDRWLHLEWTPPRLCCGLASRSLFSGPHPLWLWLAPPSLRRRLCPW